MSNDDAWALLSLKSSSLNSNLKQDVIKNENGQRSANGGSAIARLESKDFEYMVTQKRIVIGRNSNKGNVDVDMGDTNTISRRHLEIFYQNGSFYLQCNGKNGVFVDGIFFKNRPDPYRLPRSTVIRFPSTNVKLTFQSMIDDSEDTVTSNNNVSKNKNSQQLKDTIRSQPVKMAPLKLKIPEQTDQDFISPMPSPTGTLSAANSCPASPRSNARYHRSNQNDPLQTMVTYATHNIADDPTNNLHHATVYTSQPSGIINLENNIANVVNVQTHHPSHIQNSSHDYYAISSNQQIGNLQVGASESVCVANSPSEGDDAKPPYSYAQLIVQAISSAADKQLTLSGIYTYITRKYPYYTIADKGWQNSIRHNLSLNRYFQKVPRSQEEPGKGSFWRIDPNSETKLIEQSFKRRRQRPNMTCFRKDNRSATSSPNQLGSGTVSGLVTPESLSRESSPPPDLVDPQEQALNSLNSLMGPPNHQHLAGLTHSTYTISTINPTNNEIAHHQIGAVANARHQTIQQQQQNESNINLNLSIPMEHFNKLASANSKSTSNSNSPSFTTIASNDPSAIFNAAAIVNNNQAAQLNTNKKVMVSQLYTTSTNGDKEQLYQAFSASNQFQNPRSNTSAPRAIAVDNNTLILQSTGPQGLATASQPNLVISSTPAPTLTQQQQSNIVVPQQKTTYKIINQPLLPPQQQQPQQQQQQSTATTQSVVNQQQQQPQQQHSTVIVHASSTTNTPILLNNDNNKTQLAEIVDSSSVTINKDDKISNQPNDQQIVNTTETTSTTPSTTPIIATTTDNSIVTSTAVPAVVDAVKVENKTAEAEEPKIIVNKEEEKMEQQAVANVEETPINLKRSFDQMNTEEQPIKEEMKTDSNLKEEDAQSTDDVNRNVDNNLVVIQNSNESNNVDNNVKSENNINIEQQQEIEQPKESSENKEEEEVKLDENCTVKKLKTEHSQDEEADQKPNNDIVNNEGANV